MKNKSNKTVIILNGHPRSGKTTFSKILQNEYGATIRSSIDLVKEMAEVYFNWDGGKSETDRRFLSDFKLFLSEHTSLIGEDLDTYFGVFRHNSDRFYVIDIREPDEIKKFKERYNAVTVFVENPNAQIVNSNPSDAGVTNMEYDYTLKNSGTLKDLEFEVCKFVKWVNINHGRL